MNAATHQHDWRIDPHVILTSNPPQSRLVCCVCGAVTSSGPTHTLPSLASRNPKDWLRPADPPGGECPPADTWPPQCATLAAQPGVYGRAGWADQDDEGRLI